MTAEQQWTRVTEVLRTSVDAAGQIRHLHKGASRQIDSASYAIQEMLDELATVMPVGRLAQTGRDNLHRLPEIAFSTSQPRPNAATPLAA